MTPIPATISRPIPIMPRATSVPVTAQEPKAAGTQGVTRIGLTRPKTTHEIPAIDVRAIIATVFLTKIGFQ
jgi:hypothetical protein